MKRIAVLFLALFLFGCAANNKSLIKSPKYKEFANNLELINSNIEQGKYKKAIEIIDFLIGAGLKDVRLFYNRGICLSNTGLYSKAVDDFKYVIKNAENKQLKAKAYTAIGYCKYKLDDEDAAVLNFQKAIQIDKDYLAFYSLGYLYMNKQEYIKAKIRFYRSIEENPQFVPAYINLGKCYIKLGEFERAKDTLLAAANFDNSNPEVFYDLGYVYDTLNDYNMSILYYTKALDLTPMFAPAYINRGLVYLYINKKDKACRDFKQACNLSFCDKYKNLKQIGICQ